jgi:magnesium chelatase subunit D
MKSLAARWRQHPVPETESQAAAPGASPGQLALLAAALLATDPAGLGGLVLRAQAGPVREAWLASLRQLMPAHMPLQRLPQHASDERILGGLDLTATLSSGRPVAQQGLLAAAHGGLLLLGMAERLPARSAAHLCAALDSGQVQLERDGLSSTTSTRFAVLAFDEALADDVPFSAALADRLALRLDLSDMPLSAHVAADAEWVQAVKAAQPLLRQVQVGSDITQALCAATLALGVHSARGAWLALCATRAAAALFGRTQASTEDASLAVQLVLAPRATQRPVQAAEEEQSEDSSSEPPQAAEPQAAEPQNADSSEPAPLEPQAQTQPEPQTLDDLLVATAAAAIPQRLLAQLLGGDHHRRSAASAGRAGAAAVSKTRGRPLGARPGAPQAGARLHLLATLRAAAPWQRLRQAQAQLQSQPQPGPQLRIAVRPADFHVHRYQQRRSTTTIFAIDASGSSALHRLAEAKGAVELLLADCYVRRDFVAVVTFRGQGAELLLPPTRSLVRAKRCLAGLPGGGGTPLAAGIDAAALLTSQVQRQGATAVVVLLTDGRANVARSGAGGRAQAQADAISAARRLRGMGSQVLLIDTSARPEPAALALSAAMGARYLALPQADAKTLSHAVQQGRV